MNRPTLSRPGLLQMDMDSTLIRCECIDEIADFLGIRKEVAAITERAMRGEIDFAESLIARVQLLAGLEASVLDEVYRDRVRLTDGAERLIGELKRHGWKVGLVSGGFTRFTERLKARLGLDYACANELEIRDGRLTGAVLGDIVDGEVKRRTLLEQAAAFGIPIEQTVAVGDGANDLPMIRAAGLGIAFHAKPKVEAEADVCIRSGGLDEILDILNPGRPSRSAP